MHLKLIPGPLVHTLPSLETFRPYVNNTTRIVAIQHVNPHVFDESWFRQIVKDLAVDGDSCTFYYVDGVVGTKKNRYYLGIINSTKTQV